MGRCLSAPSRATCGASALVAAALLLAGAALLARTAADMLSPADETAVRKLLDDYERAIEGKDIDLFRAIKPNLSADEERRLRGAFQSIGSQEVRITVQSIKADGDGVAVRIHRRDEIDKGRMIAAFPQTIVLVRSRDRWTIHEIRK